MQAPVEPPPCWLPFSTEFDGRHYYWRGFSHILGSNIIAVYDSSTELWSLLPTTGPPPPGEWGGCSVCVGRYLYAFGGWDGSSYNNDMYTLDLVTLHWTKVESTAGDQPIKKANCGLVSVDERTLCCFGGDGIGSTQPGSTFTRDKRRTDGSGWTNELHLCDVQNGKYRITYRSVSRAFVNALGLPSTIIAMLSCSIQPTSRCLVVP